MITGITAEIRPYAIYKGVPLYTKADTCRLLNVSERTIHRYIALRKIGARKNGPGRWDFVFAERDIDTFMQGRS